MHAAQSTAAGTNQHNPPADRYGSLTATHTVTNTHRNLPEQSLAHAGSDMSTRAINRCVSEHGVFKKPKRLHAQDAHYAVYVHLSLRKLHARCVQGHGLAAYS